jgi:hypothetical protein
VEVKRSGVELRYVNSYRASNEGPNNDADQAKRRIGSALLNPVDSPVIGLGAGIEPVDRHKPGNVRLALQIDSADITLAE